MTILFESLKVFQRSFIFVAYPFLVIRRTLLWVWDLQHRERLRLWKEMEQVRGLMELLMKQRNGYRWTENERRRIRAKLRALASLSPYLLLFVSPGGFLALPVLAWWLDRRRHKREDGNEVPAK